MKTSLRAKKLCVRKKVIFGILAMCAFCVAVILGAMKLSGGKEMSSAELQQKIGAEAKSKTGYIPHTLTEIVNLPTEVLTGSAITISGSSLSTNSIKSEDLNSNTVSITKTFDPAKPGTQRIYGFQDVYRGNLDANLTIQLMSTHFVDDTCTLDRKIFCQDQRSQKNIAVYFKVGDSTDGEYTRLNNSPKTLNNFTVLSELLDTPVPYSKNGTTVNYIFVVWSNDNGIPANNQSGDNIYQGSGTQEDLWFTVTVGH